MLNITAMFPALGTARRDTNGRGKSDSNPTGCSVALKWISIAIILTTVVLGIWCSYILLSQRNTNRGTYLRIETDKSSYSVGEEVHLKITCVNNHDAGITLSALSYGIEISNPENVVYVAVTRQTSQGPLYMPPFSEQFVANYNWNQKGLDKNQLPRNTYTIRIYLLDSTISGTATITIR